MDQVNRMKNDLDNRINNDLQNFNLFSLPLDYYNEEELLPCKVRTVLIIVYYKYVNSHSFINVSEIYVYFLFIMHWKFEENAACYITSFLKKNI